MTIQEQIEKLKQDIKNANELFNTQLAALEAQLKAQQQKKSGVWKPEVNEMYYYMASDGSFGLCRYEEDDVDMACLAIGNGFKTKEEAEWEKQHRIVKTELKRFVQDNDPRPIIEEDWENGINSKNKYYLLFDHEINKVLIDTAIYLQESDQVYASSMEVLKQAIEHIGEERLKKYYFGVK